MYLAQNIRYLRKSRNLSQEELSDKLGYKSYTTIQKWEMGASEPSISMLHTIADLFQVSINDIVYKNLEYSSPLENIHPAAVPEYDGGSESEGAELLEAYRGANEHIQYAVRKLLDLSN